MFDFIGRLHPLLVHLPIGILLLVIFFEWLPSKKKYRSLKRSINTILSIGAVTAILSCLTGYFLSINGEYDEDAVSWHQWSGIALALFTITYTWIRREKIFKPLHKFFSLLVLMFVIITGHLGGSLTHGEDFLTAGLSAGPAVDISNVNLQEAMFYDDLVKPILEDKCYQCHGSSRQKGKLRLDEPQHILKGGKNGVVLVAGKTDESEMIDRMLLPVNDEDHMPPREKKQLDEKEIEILKTWIATGADFKKSLKETGQLASVEKIMSSEKTVIISDVPTDEIRVADQTILNDLQKLGVVVIPVASGSNYLSANLINTTSLDSAINLLVNIKEQLVWLKTSEQPVTDNHLIKIGSLSKLTRLSLDRSEITDAGLVNLKSLNSLLYLNLNNTKITARGISGIASLKLQILFLYGTNIKAEEVTTIKKLLPNANIEIGNYQVPFLASDTTEAKAPPAK